MSYTLQVQAVEAESGYLGIKTKRTRQGKYISAEEIPKPLVGDLLNKMGLDIISHGDGLDNTYVWIMEELGGMMHQTDKYCELTLKVFCAVLPEE